MRITTEESFIKAMSWYSPEAPQVSIVVLNFNKAKLTIDCLQSLWEYTQGYRYEIIVVDNGSRPDEFAILSDFKGCYKLLRLDVNRYFGEGNNIGAEAAKGEFVVFMNNDVTVTSNWLPPLMEPFDKHSDCGATGPKFLYPNGMLQEAGALMDEHGGSVQIGKFQDPKLPQFNLGRTVDYVSAATVVMRKEKFEEILGFDFIYEPAYYEDVDLCLKLGQIGLKTYYIPESCVVHHENATTADPRNSALLNNIVAVNQKKFVARWDQFLKTGVHLDFHPNDFPVIRPATTAGARTAAIYTPYNINPGGGERYLLSIAEALIGAGYQTWLVTPERYSLLRITKVAGIFGLQLQGLAIITTDEAEAMQPFDVFVAMANEIAPPIAALGKKSFYCCQFPFPCSDQELERRRPWLEGFDAYILYSEFVEVNIHKQLRLHKFPEMPTHIIRPPVDMLQVSGEKKRGSIISVGRFFTGGHCKQQHMLIVAFRRLIEMGIDAELHLVGSLPSESQHREYFVECQRLAQGLPVHFHVDAATEVLVDLYAEASVYWHGGGYGVDTDVAPEKCEHFGISVVEAMSAGVIPVVVNNGGPAISVQHGISGFCYDTENELIEHTMTILFGEDDKIAQMRECAQVRAQDYSKEVFSASFSEFLQAFEPVATQALSAAQ